jgi:hypothetical protein
VGTRFEIATTMNRLIVCLHTSVLVYGTVRSRRARACHVAARRRGDVPARSAPPPPSPPTRRRCASCRAPAAQDGRATLMCATGGRRRAAEGRVPGEREGAPRSGCVRAQRRTCDRARAQGRAQTKPRAGALLCGRPRGRVLKAERCARGFKPQACWQQTRGGPRAPALARRSSRSCPTGCARALPARSCRQSRVRGRARSRGGPRRRTGAPRRTRAARRRGVRRAPHGALGVADASCPRGPCFAWAARGVVGRGAPRAAGLAPDRPSRAPPRRRQSSRPRARPQD